MKHAFLGAACLAALISASASAQPRAADGAAQPRLIARADLYGNPDRTGVALSNDGNWLTWLAPVDGVLNAWIAPVGDLSKARALTNQRDRPIRSASLSPDSSMLLFITDKGGDENFLLYGVDVLTGEQKLLTPFEKTRVTIVAASRDVPDRILIGVNNRDARWHDVHELNLKTGALRLVQKNEGYAGFLADETLALRMALKPRADGGSDYFRITDGVIETAAFESIGPEDTTGPIGFTRDGTTLYWVDSRGRNTAALFAQDLATGRRIQLAQSSRADIGGGLRNPKTGRIEAYSEYYLRNEWKALDPSVRADFDHLSRTLEGQWSVVSRTNADDVWLVLNDRITAPASYYRYDRAGRRLTKLFTTRPKLEGAPLAPMTTVEIKSRDGLTLPSYLTLPVGTDPDGDGRPNRPVPLVLLVHGGPQARDGYGYNAYHQWMANRGYAVLSANFRGSTGFGKAFTEAGNGQWGAKMHDDLLDAVDWAVRKGVTPRDKVAIVGASYGGYATLWGLAATPDRFACGVDIVGPSNLNTLLSTIPPYWEAGKRQMYRRMADPTTEAGKTWLEERSPLTRAASISKPLLIGQGANDPRVKQAESDQIVKVMRARGIPVTYVLFPDEGHGFARPENNIAFNAVAENFLQRCLGGRAEPIGDALQPSTIQVVHGSQFAPGLAAALQAKPSAPPSKTAGAN